MSELGDDDDLGQDSSKRGTGGVAQDPLGIQNLQFCSVYIYIYIVFLHHPQLDMLNFRLSISNSVFLW